MQDPRSLWNSMTCVNQCYPSESTPQCCRVVLQGSVHPFEEPPIKKHGHTHGSPVTLEVCTCASVADAASLLQAQACRQSLSERMLHISATCIGSRKCRGSLWQMAVPAAANFTVWHSCCCSQVFSGSGTRSGVKDTWPRPHGSECW